MKKQSCEEFMSHFAFVSEIKHALSFSVTVGCGTTSGENCTYFEVTGAVAGTCASQICPSADVCQVCPYINREDVGIFFLGGRSKADYNRF